jgi:hypothetical protein
MELLRGELFEMMWKEPLRKVADRLGISDVGFAKACRSLNIPVPPRGRWAKLQHGKRVRRRPDLPSAPDGLDQVRMLRQTKPKPVENLPDDIKEVDQIGRKGRRHKSLQV